MTRAKKLKKFDIKKTRESVALLKAMGHPLRYSILCALLDEGEIEAGEIAEMAKGVHLPSQVSQYLTILKDEGYISRRAEGRLTYYKVADKSVKRVVGLLRTLNGF